MSLSDVSQKSHGVTCPQCEHDKSRVDQTKRTAGGKIWRRRVCLRCSAKFSTWERSTDWKSGE